VEQYNNKGEIMRTEEFDTLLKELNEIENINCGGCAIVAYGLQQKLQQHGKKATIVYILGNSMYDNNNRSNIESNQPASCKHAVIRRGRYYYDSKGRVSKRELIGYWADNPKDIELVPVSKELVFESIKVKRLWNSFFDRKSGIKAIEKILNIKLNIKE
jgi:hypothetical protein